MDRKYKTSHQGIAAYLLTKGYDILRTEQGTNKGGKACTFIEFDVDQTTGRQLGDAFFEGRVNGDLKQFHDACFTIRNTVYDARK